MAYRWRGYILQPFLLRPLHLAPALASTLPNRTYVCNGPSINCLSIRYDRSGLGRSHLRRNDKIQATGVRPDGADS